MLAWEVDLLTYQDQIQVKEIDSIPHIYCQVRHKWLVQQPEEMVRQLVISYLVSNQAIRIKSIKVESNNHQLGEMRSDIVVYNSGKPFLLIECKAWTESINQSVFNQIARYNLKLQFPYCWVTNGRTNYIFSQQADDSYHQMSNFPKGYV